MFKNEWCEVCVFSLAYDGIFIKPFIFPIKGGPFFLKSKVKQKFCRFILMI